MYRNCLVKLSRPVRVILGGRQTFNRPQHLFSYCRCRRRGYCQQRPDEIPVERIRNFCIIAHVDHGKSTFADRLLEITGAVSKNSGHAQILDTLQVERDRGITVKAQTVSLFYKYPKDEQIYLLNLIDTPGHVDFANEVSRSLAACDGVVLLVDACSGIQAQTVANYDLARKHSLHIVPVLNKIDMKHANPAKVSQELDALFEIPESSVLQISAKLGTGIDAVLNEIVRTIPAPSVSRTSPFRSLLFDSWYDKFRGALNLLYVKDGSIRVGQEIQSIITRKTYPVKSISLLRPTEIAVERLAAGQVGLISCNMRSSKESIVGDTFHRSGTPVEALTRFQPKQPMVFAGIYPSDQSKYVALRSAIEKLILNDSVVTLTPDSSPALGQGWRLGFLGLLHLEVFCQRLEQEHSAEPIITAPSVTYKLKLRSQKLIQRNGSDILLVSNAAMFPERLAVAEYYEPYVIGTIITPSKYVGQIMGLCTYHRGQESTAVNIDQDRLLLKYLLPLSEIIFDFNDKLMAISSGYASFTYENYGYHETDITRLEIHLNGRALDEMSRIVHPTKALATAKDLVGRLKELIPRQMVQIAIQACVGSKVLARETIQAYRKDVTAKLYGGDVTRRMKLLKQQSEGKKKMKSIANIRVPHETFIKVLKR